MYILDSHIHMGVTKQFDGTMEEMRAQYLKDLAAAGVAGSQVMSVDNKRGNGMTAEDRLHQVMEFCNGYDNLFPFFWLDPMEDDFLEQIDKAVEAGIDGFKIICSEHFPNEENCMAAYKRIAEHNKPILFHTGICWDGMESAEHFRPARYECLLDVPNLRFCLAHVSWPWTDECIAVYGKFNNAKNQRPELSCEMFIDITPGTPQIYRREVLTRLFCSDYQVMYNVMFGSDCMAEGYNIDWTKKWLDVDVPIIRECHPDNADDVLEHVYSKNFLRFIGKIEEDIDRVYSDVAV